MITTALSHPKVRTRLLPELDWNFPRWKANELTLNKATDGQTSRKLRKFIYFKVTLFLSSLSTAARKSISWDTTHALSDMTTIPFLISIHKKTMSLCLFLDSKIIKTVREDRWRDDTLREYIEETCFGHYLLPHLGGDGLEREPSSVNKEKTSSCSIYSVQNPGKSWELGSQLCLLPSCSRSEKEIRPLFKWHSSWWRYVTKHPNLCLQYWYSCD